MENHNALCKEKVKTFLPKGTLTAFGVASEYIHSLPSEKIYLGWDHEIYPKYKLEKEWVD